MGYHILFYQCTVCFKCKSVPETHSVFIAWATLWERWVVLKCDSVWQNELEVGRATFEFKKALKRFFANANSPISISTRLQTEWYFIRKRYFPFFLIRVRGKILKNGRKIHCHTLNRLSILDWLSLKLHDRSLLL